MRQNFRLINLQVRANAKRAIEQAPEGYMCEIKPAPKRRIQEAKYHAMIADIARQVDLIGERRSKEDAKRLLIDAFARVMRASGTPLKQEGKILPSLDGSGFVQLGVQSRKFDVKEASEFIEYLCAYGAGQGVVWTDKRYEDYGL